MALEEASQTGAHSRWADAMRLLFLRLVIISSAAAMGYMIYASVWVGNNDSKNLKWASLGPVLTGITIVHHLGTAFGPRLFPFPAWLDLFMTALESISYIAIVALLVYRSMPETGNLQEEFFPKIALIAWIVIWVLTLSVLALLLLKVLYLISARKICPLQRPVVIANLQNSPRWKFPVQALFGRSMWEQSVPGESTVLSSLRGLLTLAAVFSLVTFGIYQAIILPIGEMGMTPHRAYRTVGLDYSTVGEINHMEFKVLLVWYRHRRGTTNLTSAVTATARWTQRATEPIQSKPPVDCRVGRAAISWLPPQMYDIAVAKCPRSPNQGNNPNPRTWWDFPNFDLRVNYTGLIGGPDGAMADRVNDSLRVYLGLMKNLDDVFLNTEPVSLFPGTNMLSVANLMLRQRLAAPRLATLGFETRQNSLVSRVVQTIPNPFTGPATDPNISTLGFTLQNVINEWLILQDYRSKSAISGLTALGGLGSFLSTMLAMLLGTSLVRAVYGAKPYSPFGFLHNLGRLKQNMVRECDKAYPALRAEIENLEARPGIVAYLFNTLIDFETLGYGTKEANPSVTNGATPSKEHGHGRGASETDALMHCASP